jgi:hypothetical protein
MIRKKPHMSRRFTCLLLLTFAYITAAGAQEEPPWKMTIGERIARRLDARGMAERRRIQEPKLESASATPAKFVIDGRENPELFLPSELMALLLASTHAAEESPRAKPTAYAPWLAHFGWSEEEFWRDLAENAADYFVLTERSNGDRRTVEMSRRICASRAAALRAMRFSYPRFDEFLYLSVAPHYTMAANEVVSAEWLSWVEGGCQ